MRVILRKKKQKSYFNSPPFAQDTLKMPQLKKFQKKIPKNFKKFQKISKKSEKISPLKPFQTATNYTILHNYERLLQSTVSSPGTSRPPVTPPHARSVHIEVCNQVRPEARLTVICQIRVQIVLPVHLTHTSEKPLPPPWRIQSAKHRR